MSGPTIEGVIEVRTVIETHIANARQATNTSERDECLALALGAVDALANAACDLIAAQGSPEPT